MLPVPEVFAFCDARMNGSKACQGSFALRHIDQVLHCAHVQHDGRGPELEVASVGRRQQNSAAVPLFPVSHVRQQSSCLSTAPLRLVDAHRLRIPCNFERDRRLTCSTLGTCGCKLPVSVKPETPKEGQASITVVALAYTYQ